MHLNTNGKKSNNNLKTGIIISSPQLFLSCSLHCGCLTTNHNVWVHPNVHLLPLSMLQQTKNMQPTVHGGGGGGQAVLRLVSNVPVTSQSSKTEGLKSASCRSVGLRLLPLIESLYISKYHLWREKYKKDILELIKSVFFIIKKVVTKYSP